MHRKVVSPAEAKEADDRRYVTCRETDDGMVIVTARLHPDEAARVMEALYVSAETSRRLLCDAGVVPVFVDSDGNALDIGRKTRKISAALRRALEERDGVCQFPGCTYRRDLDVRCTDDGLQFFDPEGKAIPRVPRRPRVEPLVSTKAAWPQWDGTHPDYGRCVDALMAASSPPLGAG